jgi:hypothetical protein
MKRPGIHNSDLLFYGPILFVSLFNWFIGSWEALTNDSYFTKYTIINSCVIECGSLVISVLHQLWSYHYLKHVSISLSTKSYITKVECY